MDKKIVDIYNLDNFNLNSNLTNIKIYIEKNKIVSLKINEENFMLKNIIQNKNGNELTIKFKNIIESMDFIYVVAAIKIKIYNIKSPIILDAYNIYSNELFNEQILIDELNENFQLIMPDFYNNDKKKETGNIQIIISPLLCSYPYDYIYNNQNNYEFISPNKKSEYILTKSLIYIKTHSSYIIDKYINLSDKLLKKIHINFKSELNGGILEFECYKPTENYYFVLTKIILNDRTIITKNNHCDCEMCIFLNKFKSINELQNKTNICRKTLLKISSILIDYKIKNFIIDLTEFKKKFNFYKYYDAVCVYTKSI